MQARYSRKIVKPGIKRQYPPNPVLLHHRNVQRVAGRKPWMTKHDSLGAFKCRRFYGKHLIDDAEQSVKSALYGIATVDCHVAMQ